MRCSVLPQSRGEEESQQDKTQLPPFTGCAAAFPPVKPGSHLNASRPRLHVDTARTEPAAPAPPCLLNHPARNTGNTTFKIRAKKAFLSQFPREDLKKTQTDRSNRARERLCAPFLYASRLTTDCPIPTGQSRTLTHHVHLMCTRVTLNTGGRSGHVTS